MAETTATYTIRIKNGSKAENILEQIDELMLWFEKMFPCMEVSVP